jgi:hypothetical protein
MTRQHPYKHFWWPEDKSTVLIQAEKELWYAVLLKATWDALNKRNIGYLRKDRQREVARQRDDAWEFLKSDALDAVCECYLADIIHADTVRQGIVVMQLLVPYLLLNHLQIVFKDGEWAIEKRKEKSCKKLVDNDV